MSTESLHSLASTSSYLDRLGSTAPPSWRKPRSKIYDYNRELGYEYYQVTATLLVSQYLSKLGGKSNP